jgi:glycosyltransferase involved in cell wall biosynthesis
VECDSLQRAGGRRGRHPHPSALEDPLLTPLVSVVVPAYDVATYLPRCLGSVLRQSLGFDRLEVVAIDDGSTDGTGELLDRFASGRPNVTVVHQPNSGGPGGPRNLGVSLSRGEHLFFLDPDDHLGPEALERMVAAARRNDADVVLGKIVGVGRNAPRRPFASDVERGDLLTTRAVWSLSCQKLFRRSHVLEQGLRFLEGVRLGEDQQFVVGAYLTARVISVVASYPCYYLELRDGAGNATRTDADPVELYDIVARVLAMLDEHAPDGPVRAEVLGRYYAVEVSSRLGGAGFLRLAPELRAAYVRQVRPLVERWFDDALLAGFPSLDRVRHHLLRQGALAELEVLAAFEVHAPRNDPLVESGRAYARYPFLRTDVGVPDGCYDITTELALDHCRVRPAWEGAALTVAWQPCAPALQAPGVRWSLTLEPRGAAGRRTWSAAEGSGRLQVPEDALAALPDGGWALVTSARGGGRRAHLAVGAAGTVPDPLPRPRLLGGRLGTLRRDGRGRVHLELARATDRLPVATTAARWSDDAGATLLLEGHVAVDGLAAALARDPRSWTASVLLQQRGSGRRRESPAALRAEPGGEVGFRGMGRLAADETEPHEPGRWDVSLRIGSADVQLTGRLDAPAEQPPHRQVGDSALAPYTTVRGNLSVEVRPAPRAVLVLGARWSGRAVLHLRLAPPGTGGGAVVLRNRRLGLDAVLAATTAAPGPAVDVRIDLARALADGSLVPGTWELRVHPEQGSPGPERRLQPGPQWSCAGSRRWPARNHLLSSQLRPHQDGLVVVVARVSPARFVRRQAEALRSRLRSRA